MLELSNFVLGIRKTLMLFRLFVFLNFFSHSGESAWKCIIYCTAIKNLPGWGFLCAAGSKGCKNLGLAVQNLNGDLLPLHAIVATQRSVHCDGPHIIP